MRWVMRIYRELWIVFWSENLNIYKKSVKETENKYNEIEDKYRNLLNNIDADYSDISKLKNQVDKQAHILSYAQDITRYVERISLNKSILQRKFYIVLSYNKAEITATADFSEQELYNICYRELYTRAQSLISALSGCSVTGKVLNSNELAELLYISYNRDDEKLLDIKTALESGFYRLYSTSKDVFEKREEAMQREVNEEAKRRVQEAIQDVLKDQEKKTPDELVEEYEERGKRSAEFYAEYQKTLMRSNALDFDDLLLYTVYILQHNDSIKENLHRKYRYCIADENQDSSYIDYLFIKEIVSKEKNIALLGDTDQAIYGFRGSSPDNLKRLAEYFDAAILHLDTNYRSTQTIVNAGKSLIDHNSYLF